MTITIEAVGKIMPHLPTAKLSQLFPFLSHAMSEGQITTPIREAAFLAQLACESAELRYMEEIADGSAYEGRKDLGNLWPGDGKRYKGRGPIQLTGRNNYRTAGSALGIDLEAFPERAASPEVGFRVAVWFWGSRKLNMLADAIPAETALGAGLAFNEITRRINGGLLGKAQRDLYFARARAVLGC